MARMRALAVMLMLQLLGLAALGFGSGPACLGEATIGTMNMLDTTAVTYSLSPKLLTLGTQYSVSADGASAGMIKRDLFAWGATYNFYDFDGTALGSAKESIWKNPLNPGNWRVLAEVYDEHGEPLGSLEQITMLQGGSLFDYGLTFEIKDVDSNTLLISDQRLHLTTYKWELRTEKNGPLVGTISTPQYGIAPATELVLHTDIDRRLVLGLQVLQLEVIARMAAQAEAESGSGDSE